MPFHNHDWKEARRCGEGHRQIYYAQADAVLALLGGSAGEQVEP